MTTTILLATTIAATITRWLDPWTSLYQTDDAREGAALRAEPGYWPISNGLIDPLAKKLEPRIIYSCYRIAEEGEQNTATTETTPSPLFKVSEVGYLPWAPKYAYIGAWLGPQYGAWQPHSPMTSWQLIDAATGETVIDSPKAPQFRIADARTKDGILMTGEETYEMDFSSVTREGEFYIRVPGVGRSKNFRISANAALDAFRVHMLGLYQKRCGIAKVEPWTHWTAGACHTEVVRGSFPPDEGRLTPKVRWFEIIRDNTPWQEGTRVRLAGGWHDAADYDRRPMHLNIVGDLCAVYFMRPDRFSDSQLRMPERANDIPDILDEAEWGLRHLFSAQQPDGGVGTWIETRRHPEPGNIAESDPMQYALSRATRRSSLSYAAHAALLARANDKFRDKYLASAKRAWDFALMTRPQSDFFEIKRRHHRFFTKLEAVEWDEDEQLPVRELVKAAINLYALTQDTHYIAALELHKGRLIEEFKRKAWNWPPLSFSAEIVLGLPDIPMWHRAGLDEFFTLWKQRVMHYANEALQQMETSYAYRVPWWEAQESTVNAMSWGQSHPLRRAQALIAAHRLTGEEKYLAAASLANDFHNGCNPMGATLTSGLGQNYPIAFLDLPSYVDGIAEYVPGITPYRWTYNISPKVEEQVFGGDKALASEWPIWRRWGNMENQTVKASEYTVWETIGPAASVTGYLMAPAGDSHSLPPLPQPASKLSDLAGYWPLP